VIAARTVPRPWREVALAVAYFGIGGLLLASGLPLRVHIGEGPAWSAPGWARLAVLAAVCLTLLLRSRAPVLALILGVLIAAVEVPFGLSLAVLIVLADLLYRATLDGSERASRVIVVVVGSLILLSAIASFAFAGDWRAALVTLLLVCTFPLVPVWWAINVRQHRRIAEVERARADQLARIAELDRWAAVAAERAWMARDLHDVIAGHLSAIAIQSEAVLSMADGGDPATVRGVLRSVRDNSVASLNEMRTMIGLLRADDEAAEAPTAPARLRDLEPLLRSARAAGLRVTATTSELEPELPAAVDLSAYRIVQEALTNAIKHAPNATAEVDVRRRDGTLVVEVVNDRPAAAQPAPAPADGTGLTTMRERAQAVGGVLVAGPFEGGWRVRAELPVEGQA
jgi:signal transduction histidine kinase